MIYVVSHYYLPTSNPPANRMGCLTRALVKEYGPDAVQVITGRPNYPDGKLLPEHRGKLFCREKGPFGERVLHLFEIPAPFRGFYRKTLGYLSFAVSVFTYFLFKRLGSADLVLVTSGPIFPAYAIWFISRFRRKLRYIVDVRDLSPQTILGMGYLKECHISYRMLKWLSDRAYAGAEAAVGVVEGIRDHLAAAAAPDRASLIYNPIDTEVVGPKTPSEVASFRQEHHDVFSDPEISTFLFAGALSVYMDLLTLLEALTVVNSTTREYKFLIIGYGEQQEILRQYVDEHDLGENVVFIPHMERGRLLDYVRAVDFCFSSYNPHPIYQMAISIKILEYLACDRPVLCAHEGPFFRTIEEKGFARITPPGNAARLAESILELIRDRDTYREPRGAREFIVDTFSVPRFEERYLSIMKEHYVPTE